MTLLRQIHDRVSESNGKSVLAKGTEHARPTPVFQSNTLFGEENKVTIIHRGEQYSLRITGQGKLLLTK